MKRTAEKIKGSGGYHSAVRFTDYKSARSSPSSKLLGYYHPSALRTNKSTYWAKPLTPKSEPNSTFPLLVCVHGAGMAPVKARTRCLTISARRPKKQPAKRVSA